MAGILFLGIMACLLFLLIAPLAFPDTFVNEEAENTVEDKIQVCEHSLEEKRFAVRTTTVNGRPSSMGTLLGLDARVMVQVPETGFQAEINFANWTCENVDGWPAWVEFEEGCPKAFPVMDGSEKETAGT